MNARGKSDGPIVPMSPANNGDAESSADPPSVCARGRGKGASKEEHQTAQPRPDAEAGTSKVTRAAWCA